MRHLCIAALIALIATASVHAGEKKESLFILSGQPNMARLQTSSSFTPTGTAAFGKESIIVVKDARGRFFH